MIRPDLTFYCRILVYFKCHAFIFLQFNDSIIQLYLSILSCGLYHICPPLCSIWYRFFSKDGIHWLCWIFSFFLFKTNTAVNKETSNQIKSRNKNWINNTCGSNKSRQLVAPLQQNNFICCDNVTGTIREIFFLVASARWLQYQKMCWCNLFSLYPIFPNKFVCCANLKKKKKKTSSLLPHFINF